MSEETHSIVALKTAKSLMDNARALDKLKRVSQRAKVLGNDVRDRLAKLPAHGVLPGEAEVRDKLDFTYRVAAVGLNNYRDRFGSVTTLGRVVGIAEISLEKIQPAETSIRDMCAALLAKNPSIPGLDNPIAALGNK